MSLQRLKALETQLPTDRFIRIDNSFIVSLAAIDVVHIGEVQIGDKFIPIGDTYRKSFKDFMYKKQI